MLCLVISVCCTAACQPRSGRKISIRILLWYFNCKAPVSKL